MPAQRIVTTDPSTDTQLLLLSTLAPEFENVTTGEDPVEVTDAEDATMTVALEVASVALEVAPVALEDETCHGFDAEDVVTVALEATSAALEEEATLK